MNEPIERYNPGYYGDMVYEPRYGEWVEYSEYEKLKAEVERLRKAGDAMAEQIYNEGKVRGITFMSNVYEWNAAKEGKQSEEVLWVQLEDYEKLKAENERLRKAGDELYYWAGAEDCPQRVYDAWNAAKEGKQS